VPPPERRTIHEIIAWSRRPANAALIARGKDERDPELARRRAGRLPPLPPALEVPKRQIPSAGRREPR